MKYKIQIFRRSRNLSDLTEQVYFISLSSAYNLCKQFGPSLDPGQHRQNACPDLDSTGPNLDPKYLTHWL